jgi:hypothetical protein
MTAQRTLQELAEDWSQPAAAGQRNLDATQWNFELIPPPRWSPPVVRDACNFLDAHDTSHPFQWPQWSGDGAFLAVLRSGKWQDGRIRWFAQGGVIYPASRILRPIRALMVNRGPVCDDLEVLDVGLRRLIEQAGSMKCSYVDIIPEWTGVFADSAAEMLARNGWEPLPHHRSSLRLSLQPSLDELLASFRKTTRYEVRRALSAGIEVSLAREEDDHRDFLRLYEEMAIQKGFPSEPPNFLLAVLRWLASEPQRGGLFLARETGSLRGGVLIIRSGSRCWYVLGASSKEGKIGAGHLLQWCALQWAKQNGCTEYDFGGYREGATSGPALFKKGFCERVVHFIAPHRFIVNPGLHRASEVIGQVRRNLRFGS